MGLTAGDEPVIFKMNSVQFGGGIMNKVVTSKEEILAASRELVLEKGIMLSLIHIYPDSENAVCDDDPRILHEGERHVVEGVPVMSGGVVGIHAVPGDDHVFFQVVFIEPCF